jgi:haloalkane dehalogenase
METLRTPESRFAALPDFPYPPHYADLSDQDGGALRVAWVEDGPPDAQPVLLLHGEPSWSFLYRSMIPIIAGAGYRAIAPDLVGFGRSDKPAMQTDHSYLRHVEWMRSLAFDVLDLRDLTIVGQDWGGLIGLRLVAEHADRVSRIVASNTGLPTGEHRMPEVWWRFRRAVETAPQLDIGRLVQSGCVKPLSDDARAAYDAPFPSDAFCAGPRAMPGLVPVTLDDPAAPANRAAWTVLATLPTPALIAFSDRDPITAAMRPVLTRALQGAVGREQPIIEGAGHFLQEDAGPELARHIVEFADSSPVSRYR